jgi:2-oxo-3-hexenedioate decarboxylase
MMVMKRRGEQVSVLVGRAGERLEAGSLVMAGGATAAAPLVPGVRVQCDMQHLVRVGFWMPA